MNLSVRVPVCALLYECISYHKSARESVNVIVLKRACSVCVCVCVCVHTNKINASARRRHHVVGRF